jgi:hypothetical protein
MKAQHIWACVKLCFGPPAVFKFSARPNNTRDPPFRLPSVVDGVIEQLSPPPPKLQGNPIQIFLPSSPIHPLGRELIAVSPNFSVGIVRAGIHDEEEERRRRCRILTWTICSCRPRGGPWGRAASPGSPTSAGSSLAAARGAPTRAGAAPMAPTTATPTRTSRPATRASACRRARRCRSRRGTRRRRAGAGEGTTTRTSTTRADGAGATVVDMGKKSQRSIINGHQ